VRVLRLTLMPLVIGPMMMPHMTEKIVGD